MPAASVLLPKQKETTKQESLPPCPKLLIALLHGKAILTYFFPHIKIKMLL
jgi:hypothetical protein